MLINTSTPTVACEKLDPLLNNSLITRWIIFIIEHWNKKLTQVLSQYGMKHGLSGIHICRVILEKTRVLFFSQVTVGES